MLLRSVQMAEATERTPGVEDAVESGLITIGEDGSLDLTPLGEYLLPPEDLETASVKEESRGHASGAPTPA